MNVPHWITPTSHPLCAGPGCNTCARHEAELNERRKETLDQLDALDEPDQLRALRWLAWNTPDAVDDALREEGLSS